MHGRAPHVANAGQFRFQQDSPCVAESAGAVEIGVERIKGTDGEVTIGVDTFDGTATAGEDYRATAEVATFADVETEKIVSIPIFDNSTAEPDETFLARLNLIAGMGSIIEPSEITITILDDDTTPSGVLHFSAEKYATLESSGKMMAGWPTILSSGPCAHRGKWSPRPVTSSCRKMASSSS